MNYVECNIFSILCGVVLLKAYRHSTYRPFASFFLTVSFGIWLRDGRLRAEECVARDFCKHSVRERPSTHVYNLQKYVYICIYTHTHTINCVLNCDMSTTQTWSSMPSSRAVERTSTQKSFGRKSVVPTVGIRFFVFGCFQEFWNFTRNFTYFWLTLLVRRWADSRSRISVCQPVVGGGLPSRIQGRNWWSWTWRFG